jgi:hypothetical protein
VAAGVPVPFAQIIWRKLHVSGEDVLAVRSKPGIENGGNGDVEPGRA